MPKSCCSMKRSVVAGAIGGIVAVAVIAILGALLLRRVGPRMMSEGGCSEEMRACMEKCGCGRPENADGADRS
jgi:hypothetical protein